MSLFDVSAQLLEKKQKLPASIKGSSKAKDSKGLENLGLVLSWNWFSIPIPSLERGKVHQCLFVFLFFLPVLSFSMNCTV